MIWSPEPPSRPPFDFTLPAGWHFAQRDKGILVATPTGLSGDMPKIIIGYPNEGTSHASLRRAAPREAREQGVPGRWVTVGGHPAYQVTYPDPDAPTRMVTELRTLDRVVSMGREMLIIWTAQKPRVLSRRVYIRLETSEEQHSSYWPDFERMLESWNWHSPKPAGFLRKLIWGGLPGLWLNRRPDRGGQTQRRMRTSWRFWLGVFFVFEGVISLTMSPGHPTNLAWAALGFIVGAALIFWAKKRATGW
jgi:hypothetical protein